MRHTSDEGEYIAATNHIKSLAEFGDIDAQLELALMYCQGKLFEENYEESTKWFYRAATNNSGNCKGHRGVDHIGHHDHDHKGHHDHDHKGHHDHDHSCTSRARAQNGYGIALEEGRGVAKNLSEAVKWYKLSAEQGEVRAMLNLAIYYRSLTDGKDGREEASQWLDKATQVGKNDYRVYHNLFVAHYNEGIRLGTDPDKKIAMEWCFKGAENGNPACQLTLARFYSSDSNGLEKDLDRAMELYKKAADQGCVNSMVALGNMLVKQSRYEESLMYYHKAAIREDLSAILKLAKYFEKKNQYSTAIGWYRKAVKYKSPTAYERLGVLLFIGRKGSGPTESVRKNSVEGVQWLLKVVEYFKGSTESALGGKRIIRRVPYHVEYYLGLAFFNGVGVDMDLRTAVKWMTISANKEFKIAEEVLGDWYNIGLADDGQVVLPRDPKMSIQLWERSVKHGNIEALNKLATSYHSGNGHSKPDPDKALECFIEAAEQGSMTAHANLMIIHSHGSNHENMLKSLYHGRFAVKNGLFHHSLNLIKQLFVYLEYFDRQGKEQVEILKECRSLLKEFKRLGGAGRGQAEAVRDISRMLEARPVARYTPSALSSTARVEEPTAKGESSTTGVEESTAKGESSPTTKGELPLHPNLIPHPRPGMYDDFTLESLMDNRREPLSITEIIYILNQVCDALIHCQSHKFAHMGCLTRTIYIVPPRSIDISTSSVYEMKSVTSMPCEIFELIRQYLSKHYEKFSEMQPHIILKSQLVLGWFGNSINFSQRATDSWMLLDGEKPYFRSSRTELTKHLPPEVLGNQIRFFDSVNAFMLGYLARDLCRTCNDNSANNINYSKLKSLTQGLMEEDMAKRSSLEYAKEVLLSML